MSSKRTIDEQRQLIRPLLAPTDPQDALPAYYALWHDARRTRLTVHMTPTGRADAFVAVCQTGQDLFVPLVIVRAWQQTADHVLRQALSPKRPYRVIGLPSMQEAIQETMLLERWQINHVYTLDPSTFRQVVNAMVQPGKDPFRFEIRSGSKVAAAAGINWRSDKMAELYVYVESESQHRGWGRAVAVSSVSALLKAGLLPIYTVAESNEFSKRLAHTLGFHDSGAREFEALGQLRV
ncbi:MAG: GNAT family N-acetyltransferase [Anaerolineae bacterium]|nr:GNAT family N-acetyltransferase [Anaerolineae bacterium]